LRRIPAALAAALLSCFVTACTDDPPLTAPPTAAKTVGLTRTVQLMDACEPTTFNAVLGAGACVRNGGVTFDNFLRLLGEHQKVGSWHNAPGTLNVRVGQTLEAVNRGGEEHTFTEVEAFGGGFIQLLNDLSGNPEPAPECLGLGPGDFVPAGASTTDEVDEAGTELYQCCIHPWMRTTVTARP
jgi:hypothetical protein